MNSMENSPVWQLRFSVRKVLKLVVGGTLLSFGALIIPFNQKIAAGHMPGFWNGLLYDIGPTGRWVFALACMGFFLSAAFGLSMVLVGDRVALRSTDRGIFVQTIGIRRELPWSEVVLIDILSTTYRRRRRPRTRTRRSVRIRIRAGDGEKSLLVPTNLLMRMRTR